MLAISGGAKETDFFRMIPIPNLNSRGDYAFKFFVKNLDLIRENNLELKPEKQLYLIHEFQQTDRFALSLQIDDPNFLIGYVPGCFTKIIPQIKKKYNNLLKTINIQVLQVNNQAPIQMQLLCELSSSALNEPLEQYEEECKPIFS